MSTATPAALRERCAAFLATHRLAVLSLAGPEGPWAMPVMYGIRDLTVGCRLPRWAEIGFRLESCPEVLLIVPDDAGGQRWMAVRGRGRVVESGWPELSPPDASALPPDALHTIIEVTPTRLDLVDARAGWGHRETFDL